MQLELPEAVSGLDEDSAETTLVVNVSADGSWQVAGKKLVDAAEMQSVFQARALESPDVLRLKIRTDESVTYGRIEPLLLAATQSGIGDIVFSVYEDRGL